MGPGHPGGTCGQLPTPTGGLVARWGLMGLCQGPGPAEAVALGGGLAALATITILCVIL